MTSSRGRRGNLLLSALFMAAFLFFLSVAIVVTNREDIHSTLLADHKMRAEFAADGTLDRDIELMRSIPDWEGQLNVGTSFASGASARSSYRRISPTILELTVNAASNLVKADRHWTFEEFRLADSVASGSLKPHLFALRGTALSVLGPNFKWQELSPVNAETLPRTLVANGGPVFYQVKDEIPAPVLLDFQPSIGANGVVTNSGFGPVSGTLPKGSGPYEIQLANDKFNPVQVPDPGDPKVMGRIKQATINGQENGTPTFTTINIGGTPTLIDTSEYQGPVLETYLLTGSVAGAGGNSYYCHALHVYFRGFRFRNSATATPPGSVTPSVGPLKEPAILKYDSGSKTWSKVVDLLKVIDDVTEPEIVGGPRPDVNYLWVTANGQVYTRELGSTNLLSVNGNQFHAGSPIQGELFAYQDQLVSVTKNATTGVQQLSVYDPSLTLPQNVPGRNLAAKPFFSGNLMITLKEEPGLALRYSTSPSPVATARKDLFVLITCQAFDEAHLDQPPKSSVQSLAHWDGTQWQFLPAGMATVLPNSSYTLEGVRDYGGKAVDVGGFVALALAGYPSSQPLLRQYSPRFHN